MPHLIKRSKYKISSYAGKDFPLFINAQNEENHVLHDHDFTELVIVEHGQGIHFTENFSHMIVAGDVLVIPRGVKHGYKNTQALQLTNIIFDMSLLNSFPEDYKHIPGFHSLFMLSNFQQKKLINKKGFLTLDSDEIAIVKHLANRISQEQREKPKGYKSICLLALVELIIFLSRKASKHNLAPHSEKLARVLSYMEKNYNRAVTLHELSSMINLSTRSFQRIFDSYMGISPFNYLTMIRMQHAKKLLHETELNISEIAYTTGFGDSAYFTRQFKKVFYTTPTNYRKQINLPKAT